MQSGTSLYFPEKRTVKTHRLFVTCRPATDSLHVNKSWCSGLVSLRRFGRIFLCCVARRANRLRGGQTARPFVARQGSCVWTPVSIIILKVPLQSAQESGVGGKTTGRWEIFNFPETCVVSRQLRSTRGIRGQPHQASPATRLAASNTC